MEKQVFDVLHCSIESILFLLMMFFWYVCSHKFGEDVDTSIHPNLGQGGDKPPPLPESPPENL